MMTKLLVVTNSAKQPLMMGRLICFEYCNV